MAMSVTGKIRITGLRQIQDSIQLLGNPEVVRHLAIFVGFQRFTGLQSDDRRIGGDSRFVRVQIN